MTMEGQIDYLLTRMISTEHELFRNKIHYTPRQGTEFLRWKLGRPQYKPNIHSARDFVHMISSGSVTSGKPYEVILEDGSRHNLEAIFSNELALLEEQERKMEKILLIEQVAFGGST